MQLSIEGVEFKLEQFTMTWVHCGFHLAQNSLAGQEKIFSLSELGGLG
ncbi:MAG TPA: hypothetical protein VMX38_19805 [Verrucomicrobiae bacterium]|nr:hypothetical protein [Verrucomicrobiae bacterium]